jgi:uncharacterized protein YjbJ (UPF0337 family)
MSTQKTPDPVEKAGPADQLKGSVKEAIGKLIGDGKVEAEGKAQQESKKSDLKPKSASKS